jgi:hypothetical protein
MVYITIIVREPVEILVPPMRANAHLANKGNYAMLILKSFLDNSKMGREDMTSQMTLNIILFLLSILLRFPDKYTLKHTN